MLKSITHLRGTEDAWARNDVIIPDGELAIIKTKGGGARVKLGDGVSRFSELPGITGEPKECAEDEIVLLHGRSYRLGTKDALTISFPTVIDDDYYTEITFDSGIDATEFNVIGELSLTGDDVADRELMPREKTHYTVFIWYDGTLQGIVRGLKNA